MYKEIIDSLIHTLIFSIIQVHAEQNRAILAPSSASSWIGPVFQGPFTMLMTNLKHALHVSYINYAFYVHTVFFYLVMARVSLCRTITVRDVLY